jgi:F0F1-type ATP synthase assembly protein I
MQRWSTALKVLEVGWFVGIAIVAGVLGGRWLDTKLGTQPFFVIIGLFLGLATAIYGAVKMILPVLKDDDDKGNS